MQIYLVRTRSSLNRIQVEADNYTVSISDAYHFFNVVEGKQILVASFKYRDVISVVTAMEIKVSKK